LDNYIITLYRLKEEAFFSTVVKKLNQLEEEKNLHQLSRHMHILPRALG